MNRIKISFDQSIYQSKFISPQILHIGGFVKLNKINNYMKRKEYYIFFLRKKKKKENLIQTVLMILKVINTTYIKLIEP